MDIHGACLVLGLGKLLFARNLALTLAGGRRREKLTNREGGGDDEDRVLAVSFLLHRDPWRTGATAVLFRGAGEPYFAPRSPASALFDTRRACLDALHRCTARGAQLTAPPFLHTQDCYDDGGEAPRIGRRVAARRAASGASFRVDVALVDGAQEEVPSHHRSGGGVVGPRLSLPPPNPSHLNHPS